jgi:hypothetical protein
MGTQGTGDEAESADQQNQHNEGVEQAGWAKVDAHVGEDASEDEEGARHSKEPARRAATVPEEKADAK